MIRGVAAAVLMLGAAALPGWAEACPEPDRTLVWHSCWGEAEASLLLLPEDRDAIGPAETPGAESLVLSGAYTAREPRAEGHPAPVGLFIRQGELVGRNLARMDGILILGPGPGAVRLARRHAVPLDGTVYDLTVYEQRMEFVHAARHAGLSVMQSHLLVIDGESDVRPTEDAPAYIRRMLFEDAHGFGIYQSSWPLTLADAASAIVASHGARLALNLDMGSFDLCLAFGAGQGATGDGPAAGSPSGGGAGAAGAAGGVRNCGVVKRGPGLDKLSNALKLTLRRPFAG